MHPKSVRTRFAPSPTGYMHVGNLRTALYEYLIARSSDGQFIVRIEDTDQQRQTEGAEELIFTTLEKVGLAHDEGPDVGGPYGPYVQSQRLDLYPGFAHKLIDSGHAYRCFCDKNRLESLRHDAASEEYAASGYDRKCRNLSCHAVDELLASGKPYVIRQKMPLEGTTSFEDAVFGRITVDNSELEDQILLKTDGFPTYNFANVVDDHAMRITHVVRGSEYLSSTPKYNLLYDAFGWEKPEYVHLPLIIGEDGRKLSKRHGAVSFSNLVEQGYLPEAIINYLALLGWCPKENRELYSLEELCEAFSVDRISKSPSVFDYQKLEWFNGEYIRKMAASEFLTYCEPWLAQVFGTIPPAAALLAELLQPRVTRLSDIPDMIRFLAVHQQADVSLYTNKKSKSTLDSTIKVLPAVIEKLSGLSQWDRESIHEALISLAQELEMKNGQVMWPARIAVSGQSVTPGGAIEILLLLGKDESVSRLNKVYAFLSDQKEPS